MDAGQGRTIKLNVVTQVRSKTGIFSSRRKSSKSRGRSKKFPDSSRSGEDVGPSKFVNVPEESVARQLVNTVKALVKPGFGILAADDSQYQIDMKLKDLQMATTHQNRRRYHELILGGDQELNTYLSGVLMREESICQPWFKGKKLLNMIKENNLELGIRLDKGVVPLAGTGCEYTTCGLDKLEQTCARVKALGADFALWRCVYKISPFTPSRLAIVENSNTLARFAVVCQNTGLVPIVSPEVLHEGKHGFEEAQEVLREILVVLCKALLDHHVYLEGALIRVTAASPGPCNDCCNQVTKIADVTAKTINECLPPAIGGVLLAREQTLSRSLSILNAIQTCFIKKPFSLTFCFSQVIPQNVTYIWGGQDKNLKKARQDLMKRLKCCSLASLGQCPEDRTSFFIETQFQY